MGSRTANESTSVISAVASVRPGVNGTSTETPASVAAFSTAAQPPRTIRSAIETFLSPLASKSAFTFSREVSTLDRRSGSFASQNFCGDNAIRAPLAPPLRSEPLKVEAEDHAVKTRSLIDNPEPKIAAFSSATSEASICL